MRSSEEKYRCCTTLETNVLVAMSFVTSRDALVTSDKAKNDSF